jgi:hypothetical protein
VPSRSSYPWLSHPAYWNNNHGPIPSSGVPILSVLHPHILTSPGGALSYLDWASYSTSTKAPQQRLLLS